MNSPINYYTRLIKYYLNKILQRGENYRSSLAISFDHKRAQEYEFKSAAGYMDSEFLKIFEDVEKAKRRNNIYYEGILNNFFTKNERKLWIKFVNTVKEKNCLDIGVGPTGNILQWFWVKKPIAIDPLALRYKKYQEDTFGKTLWRKNTKIYSIDAENFIPELKNTVDGFIISRNALDHLVDPIKVLENISLYAKKGCYLLFWSDLWHIVPPDEGHNNITKSVLGFKSLLSGLGFEILKEINPLKKDHSTTEYGCRAVKC